MPGESNLPPSLVSPEGTEFPPQLKRKLPGVSLFLAVRRGSTRLRAVPGPLDSSGRGGRQRPSCWSGGPGPDGF